MIALVLLVFGGVTFFWLKFGVRRKRVSCQTWDCGYYALDSRTEYTATAFSKPFRIAFSFFLLPYHKSKKIRDSFYHVRQFTYETHTTMIFKNYFYEPAVRLIYVIALQMRKLQPGSIHLYIFYIFMTLVSLIVLTTIF
jgi:hydrogenase-4 component B